MSNVEDLVCPKIPSEFKGISEDICDVPICDNDHFDAGFGLINSLLSEFISIHIPKIDFLPEEFIGELDFIDPILPGTDEDDFNEEEGEIDNDIFQIEDEILQEVDTFLFPEDSMPPGVESDLGSEENIIFLDNLLNDDPIPEMKTILNPDITTLELVVISWDGTFHDLHSVLKESQVFMGLVHFNTFGFISSAAFRESEYDHIPPEEKCMALLLAEERFLKVKQAMEEEQNQPEVMQELLLKLMNDLQVLKGIQSKQAE
ncbi:hypothetical protein Tco_0152592 [Tanacetum coccineum]